jgi:hypothetical protein
MAIKKNLYKVNEGSNYTITLVSEEDFSASTISARALLDGATGTGTQIATSTGTVALTPLELELDTSTLAVGLYTVEVFADFGTADEKVVFPASNSIFQIDVVSRFGIEI